MARIQSQIEEKLAPVRSGLSAEGLFFTLSFEAAIVCFGVGIAAYFSWPTEPSKIVTLILFCILLLANRLIATHWQGWVSGFLMVALGFGWSSLSTQFHSPNPLDREVRMTVEGWVMSVDEGRPMRRLYLDILSVDRVPSTGMPEQLRIRVGKAFDPVQVGDAIRVTVVAEPLPGPVIPNGYDPARRAYFDGLAGSGFAISDFERVTLPMSVYREFQIRIEKSRHQISARVMREAPEATAGLQAALLTGLRDNIPDTQTEALRASGLAHILAISGLHMGLVAFGIYLACVGILVRIESLARARDVRKIAAIGAILFATLYLLLSGASVATQRAYIMVCIAFLAVLLDRRAISIRSVGVAALITLAIRPEALLSVGFQMSFAAVAAMVVLFRIWQDHRPYRRPEGLRDRFTQFYGSLFGTSLIAGLATGGFALLHFGRFAQYGMIANMSAMVVFPIVMGMGIVALLLMPLGLDAPALWVMSQLITLMLIIADWVSNLPGAVATVKASQPYIIALYGLGFTLACFATRTMFVTGTTFMVAAFLFWVREPTYDLRLTDTGRVSVLSGQEGQTSSLRADRYGRERFAQSIGNPDLSWQNYRDTFAQCDAMACRFILKERTISVVEEPSEVIEACETSDLVILVTRRSGPVARRNCTSNLLDLADLERMGGAHVRLGDPIQIVPLLSEQRLKRPWGRRHTR